MQTLKNEQVRLMAQAYAEMLDGTDQGAAEYDRKQAARQQAPAAIPADNWVADLYRSFYDMDLDSIRQAALSIPLYKRIGITFPELKGQTEELIAHTQTLLEIYIREAEYDSKRLAEFKTIRG